MTSRSKNARVAGLLYIVSSLVGVVRLLYIPKILFVHGDAGATANNIAAHEPLFRLGMICYLFGGVLWLFVPLALYRLLDEVDHPLAVLMVILGILQTPTYIMNTVTDAAALLLVRGAAFLDIFDKPQREAFAMLFLRLHDHLDLANLACGGLWLLPLGLLIYRSKFLPRFLGVWLMIACFAWLAIVFTGFISPDHQNQAFSLAQPFVLGEVATMFWLLILGAREPRLSLS